MPDALAGVWGQEQSSWESQLCPKVHLSKLFATLWLSLAVSRSCISGLVMLRCNSGVAPSLYF